MSLFDMIKETAGVRDWYYFAVATNWGTVDVYRVCINTSTYEHFVPYGVGSSSPWKPKGEGYMQSGVAVNLRGYIDNEGVCRAAPPACPRHDIYGPDADNWQKWLDRNSMYIERFNQAMGVDDSDDE